MTSGSCSASTKAGLSGPGSGFAVVPAAPAAGSTVSAISATSAMRRWAGALRREVVMWRLSAAVVVGLPLYRQRAALLES